MERAVVEGALEAARKDNSPLQKELVGLRSTQRGGRPLEEAPATSKDTESPDTIGSAKRGKGAELTAAVGSNKARGDERHHSTPSHSAVFRKADT